MIKLIAMDMDGTLLKSDNTIDEHTKAVLMDVQQRGVRLVLASGRSYNKLMKYAKELKMDQYGGYLIEVNGLALYDLKQQKRDVKEGLDLQDIQEIFHFGEPYELEMQAIFDDGMFIHIPERLLPAKIAYRKEHHLPEDYPWTRGALPFRYMHDNREGYPKQTYIHNIEEINRSVNKICYAAEKEEIDHFLEALRNRYENRFWIGRTTTNWLEIMPKHITKGNALSALAQTLHIDMNEILAFGDGENDIEMLQSVTYGIAMDNALDNVKAVAYDITAHHNDEGIAKAIEKYIMKA